MIRLASIAAVVGTAFTVAACGGGGGGGGSAAGEASSGGATVSVRSVGGLGDTLVGAGGKTLYTSDVEAKGGIRCTGACTSFWKPLAASGAKPTAAGDAGRLGVVKRPDGTRQVTSNGRPLYTFAEEGSGEAKGDGFTDDFAGAHFVWHAVMAGGRAASAGGSGGGAYSSGGGY